jgi:hypothetical protein
MGALFFCGHGIIGIITASSASIHPSPFYPSPSTRLGIKKALQALRGSVLAGLVLVLACPAFIAVWVITS